MTGDFPLYGFEGKAKPVYDLDSVQLIHLINQMNQESASTEKAPGGGVRLPSHAFLQGVRVSPFKKFESEVMAQYYKLYKKVKMGPISSSPRWGLMPANLTNSSASCARSGIRIPILGNVYILNRPVARVMNRGGVPGCVVTDDLYRIDEEESKAPDKGRVARLTRAAKLIAVLKGIGYDGVHIGGPNLKYEDVEWVIEKSKEFSKNWEEWVREFSFPQKDGFYLFQKDEKTGLNSDVPNFMTEPSSKEPRLCHDAFFSSSGLSPEAPLLQNRPDGSSRRSMGRDSKAYLPNWNTG